MGHQRVFQIRVHLVYSKIFLCNLKDLLTLYRYLPLYNKGLLISTQSLELDIDYSVLDYETEKEKCKLLSDSYMLILTNLSRLHSLSTFH